MTTKRRNSIFTIAPYQKRGVWMFDDDTLGLKEEAFVAGADTMIDLITTGMKDPATGFIMQFSDKPFPGYMVKLTRDDARKKEIIAVVSGEPMNVGTWYSMVNPITKAVVEGWLCPALNLYYEESPRNLYVAVRAKK